MYQFASQAMYQTLFNVLNAPSPAARAILEGIVSPGPRPPQQ